VFKTLAQFFAQPIALLNSTKNVFIIIINKTWVEQGAEQGVEEGKLPCSVPYLTPCSAHDEKLKSIIKKLKWFVKTLVVDFRCIKLLI
jgi:hypothetical protein